MDEMKVKLTQAVAARLTAAPASEEKDELIEELSDNLYRRFLEMSGAGMPEEEAFHRALDDLGDVDELLAYLGVEPAGDVTIDKRDGQTRITTKDGQKIIINGAEDEHLVINAEDGAPITIDSGDGHPITINNDEPEELKAERMAAEAERIQAEAERAQAEAGSAPQGEPDGHGGAHYSYDPNASQNDLDAILANVGEICRTAMEQVKEAAKQAKDAIRRRTTVEKEDNHVRVHFNTQPDEPVPPAPPASPEPPAPPTPPVPPQESGGWEFEAELDSDQGRFFAGGGPRKKKDVIYGFGYDKAKGGFFAQWGEWKGEYQDTGEGRGPRFSGQDSSMEGNNDGSYSVTALKDLRGIEVFTAAGDVTIHVSEAPDAGVIIDGDVDDLDVTCSADGVLTIREGRTASSSFFSRRGIGSADVELYLPARHWETISATTASGDVEIGREDGLDVEYLTISTANGDANCRLTACHVLSFKSASGDLELEGACEDLIAETMSGDIDLRGQVRSARLKTASGDIELDGAAGSVWGSSMSGDVSVATSAFPGTMELSSKSGDVEARVPDAGPFSARMKTVSGELSCSFPVNYVNGLCVYGDGSGPVYSITSVSGDVSLDRR